MNLDELQRLAEGATPGWVLELPPAGKWSSHWAYVRAPSWGVVASIHLDPSLPHWDGPQRANAAYIAAMSPDTAKKLIAVALKAAAVVQRWDTPLWKNVPATAGYINELRSALEELK